MEDTAFLRSVTLFAEFDTAELVELAKAARTSYYRPGEVVLEEGKSNRALHILRAGRLRVTRGVQGKEVALCDLEVAQTFGELSIIEDGLASATLKALTHAEVLSISIEDLASFLRENPESGARFWRAVAVDLRRRLLQTNDVVRSYFEVNRALVENATFREAYAMCNR